MGVALVETIVAVFERDPSLDGRSGEGDQ